MQSAMRVSKPNSLELAYTRKMMSFLLFQPNPKSILMLGLGGGSLAKFCYQHLPDTKITVVEINPHVLAFRNEFKIPENSERFQIVLGDAAEYVASCQTDYDVIATDAFDKYGFSSSVCNREFYENLRRLLVENGLIVSNMAGLREEKMAHLKMLSDIFGERTLAIPVVCDGNHVALAFNQTDFKPCWQTVHDRAKLLAESIGLDFEKFARKFERSKKLDYVKRSFLSSIGLSSDA
ncbi:MAG: fused MFS/spermidine synthase [Rhodocyclaceae bacterium]|nr:fused MFS/spermidine synthase [Rhodocyclaceae bacterium]